MAQVPERMLDELVLTVLSQPMLLVSVANKVPVPGAYHFTVMAFVFCPLWMIPLVMLQK